ncbi:MULTISPECIES: DUF2231 domain-containing protein [unclassified Sphingomonas]|uniref:DUF2231 domain-containing protein n=1 Tax=unclassified Sphingomonas TaxID=196159 RepID=UPI00226AA21C|nr:MULTISPECIES: DUF2231 domain-containing protein [unclassified Sphingomonas]
MATTLPPSTARTGRHPLHAALAQFPFVCFTAALVTDIAYMNTASMQWETMSVWLITGGLVVAAFAVLAGIVDAFASRGMRRARSGWLHAIGTIVALVLAIVNAFVHSRDGYTSVVPTGLTLSILVVAILAISNWWGAEFSVRQTVGDRR